MAEIAKAVLVPDYLTVRELAELIESSPIDVMKKLIANGIMASINQQIDYETAAIVIEEMGYTAQSASAAAAEEEEEKRAEQREQKWNVMYDGETPETLQIRPPIITILGHVDHGKTTLLDTIRKTAQSASAAAAEEEEEKRAEQREQKWNVMYDGETPETLQIRPPIITILGHVDHGKTTLLDTIRKTAVAEGEAGGITQHIGAYQALHDGRLLTFLDTPGHEAFTAMRARGAQGADIAILVVAADDGVMPTTREALDHARAANVPLVVAITKVDKRNSNPEMVKQQLSELELIPDDWDGNTIMIPVDSLSGMGVEDLLEALLLVADDNEIVANPEGTLRGIVVEAEVDKSRGTMATLLVMNGSMKRGDAIVAGTSYGKVKAIFDSAGKAVKSVGPSTPVSVLGLDSPPEPGVMFEIAKNDKEARIIADERRLDAQERSRSGDAGGAVTLEELFAQFKSGTAKELAIILKADVQGSLQPIVDELNNISGQNDEGIEIRILRQEVGNITESDVMLASASGAIIVGFNVNADNAAQASAETQGVELRKYSIIYKLFEDIELALHGMLEPKYENKVIGVAEVRQTFKIPRIGLIAGSMIKEGEARRNAKARLKRGNKVVIDNTGVSSLKRFQDDVREVRAGFECGIGLDGVNDYKEGDIIEFFVRQRVN